MGIASRIQESFYRWTGRTELAETLKSERLMVEHLQESMADLERRMYEPGWQQMTAMAEQEFTRGGLKRMTAVCRIMGIKNVLIKRGLALRTAYVWGQGVEISARSAGRRGKSRSSQDVNAVVQAFIADDGNRKALTGSQAAEENERSLGTDGNLFFACFTKPRTGRVQVRSLPYDEITDVITNPEDSSEVWYYKRQWTEQSTDQITGGPTSVTRTAYYPALGYRPALKPKRVKDTLGVAEVLWDAPVYHVKVGGLKGWKFGIPDSYAAIDWANAYREFLTDWARLVKALSRFAWRLTSKGSKQAAAKTRLAAGPATDRYSGEPQHAGAAAFLTPDMMLEAVPKTGATIDSESGRPLAAMVAAGLDVPVTMLLGDPGTTGNRATAETLDTPTERAMEMRRGVWTDCYQAILAYVILESVRAPEGPLKGTIVRDDSGKEIVRLQGNADTTIDVSWPDLDDLDPAAVIDSITKADATGYMPPLVVVRLLLEALGVRDVDSIIESLTGDAGEFVRPEGAGGGAGQAAVDAFRRGEDPAALLAGRKQKPDDGTGSEPEEEPASDSG